METGTSPVYSKPFFELQLVFAQKIASLSKQSLEQTLLHFSAFYRILGLGEDLDPTNVVWQEYTQGFQQTAEKVAFTHQFYLQRYHAIPKFTDEEHWGCFTYGYNSETCVVHSHFSDQDTSIYGSLSHQRIAIRKSELRMMFQQIQQRHPDANLVHGGSWLYNWEAYRRLFPPAFGQSARRDEIQYLAARAIWGQFLRRGWRVHQETMSLFLQRVNQLDRIEDYPHCFPYLVLKAEAPIHLFYEFYASC